MEEFDDFNIIIQLTKQKLIHILESISGIKELVVEHSLVRPLDKIANMSILKNHNCKRVQQLYNNKSVMFDTTIDKRVFLIRPSIDMIRTISIMIKSEPNYDYYAIFVDKKQLICELEMEKQGIYGLLDSYELNLSFIPIESDLYSLELPQNVNNSTRNDCHYIAKSLFQLQSLYGLITTQFYIGKSSNDCQILLKKIYDEYGEPPATANQPISHVFFYDRQCDLGSIFLTGLTYESMLNDVFEYNCGKITFNEQVNSKLKQPIKGKNVVALNNNDAIFGAVRNKHITQVFSFLSATAKSLQSSFDQASTMNKVEQVKDFVSNKLKELKHNQKLLELHICACEVLLETNKDASDRLAIEHMIIKRESNEKEIIKHIELEIVKKKNPWKILELACLWSLCDDGLNSKMYQKFKDLFLYGCGYEYLPVLYSLKLNGLLTEKSQTMNVNINSIKNISSTISTNTNKITFPQIIKNMNLTANSKNVFDPKTSTKPSYVFSESYTPLIVQLLSMTVSDGWNINKFQKSLGQDIPLSSNTPNPIKIDSRIKKAILLVFIGGVTYSEIASIRQYAQNNNFRIIILTSHIINREEFIKSYSEPI